jgi:glycosyltransferase involved in cell wall biosynthesis
MNRPALSIIVPALNEELIIGEFLDRVSRCLDAWHLSWEIVVVDDGSEDSTAERVRTRGESDSRIRLVRQDHGGKGAAVRRGLVAARGMWRFMVDADLSVAPEDWSALLDATGEPNTDVIVASREAPGARRIGEPAARHVIGRVFNYLVQLIILPGLHDTQCGFKLISEAAVNALSPHLTIDGFAFDVELLFLARRCGFGIREVPVVWTCRRDSRVRLTRGAAAFADIVRIRWRQWRGGYGTVAGRDVDATPGITRAAS